MGKLWNERKGILVDDGKIDWMGREVDNRGHKGNNLPEGDKDELV